MKCPACKSPLCEKGAGNMTVDICSGGFRVQRGKQDADAGPESGHDQSLPAGLPNRFAERGFSTARLIIFYPEPMTA
jgi:hypothetical protein